MKKLLLLALVALVAGSGMTAQAQTLKIKGVYQNNRYDDNGKDVKDDISHYFSIYLGYNYDLQIPIFIVQNSIYSMTWNGTTLSEPVKEPAVNYQDFYSGSISRYGNGYGGEFTDNDKAQWATNFNNMMGNSGAVYVDGKIMTVMSRDYQSTVDEEIFSVRKWDATTGDLLESEIVGLDRNLETAGMAYNPKDGKLYGFVHFTTAQLPDEITSDPDFFVDQDGEASANDDGYAICQIDPVSLQVSLVTPGLYYGNWVAFAINSEGRAFALTSGGVNAPIDDDGRMRDMYGNLTGAQLCEFDLSSGLMLTTTKSAVDSETGETYEEQVPTIPNATGYASQVHRQSMCFDKNNPNVIYWNGYFNSGKGVNGGGSYTSLPDENWIENGKYDTCLYSIDVNTGIGTRLAKIPNRFTFSCMWVEGADVSDGCGMNILAGIEDVQTDVAATTSKGVYNLSGQKVGNATEGLTHGVYIVDGKKYVVK